jgi:2-polyprenyl-6-methoxyphenol hydroxylase-like FAD-dependent oxidoreductase
MSTANHPVPAQENIAIVGAGICGMCTGLALARQGHRVTLFERDETPPDGDGDQAFYEWQRKGAAQFRHPHAFLGLMCNLLQDNYPDLLEEFCQAGARRVDLADMLRPDLLVHYKPQPGDEKLWILMCRRATIETVLRRYVERIENLQIISECQVTGMISSAAAGKAIEVTGLTYRLQDSDRQFDADLVIDASGRTSKFPKWFAAEGTTIPQQVHDAEIVYYTRHYKLNPGVEEPPRHNKEPAAGDLGYLKYGVFPGDSGNFAVILCLPLGETLMRETVRDAAGFDFIARSIPGVAPWLVPENIVATTEPFGMAGIQAQWRNYVVEGKPIAHNFFAVGDSAVRTNPLYGRGCSLGIQHAHILADVIAATPDPERRGLLFDERTEDQIRPVYKSSLGEDRSGIKRALAVAEGGLVEKPAGLKDWFGLAFGDALGAASKYELHVIRGILRTFHLLEKPGEFLKNKRIQLTVFRYMFRGRRKNAGERIVGGPSRDEMLELLTADNLQPNG